jgi:hypothetical protein
VREKEKKNVVSILLHVYYTDLRRFFFLFLLFIFVVVVVVVVVAVKASYYMRYDY